MLNSVRQLHRGARRVVSLRESRQRRNRRRFDRDLDRHFPVRAGGFQGRILVDAMWDNPNFWLRYCVLRAAAGIGPGQEVGLLGYSRRPEQRRTLKRLGIGHVVDFTQNDPHRAANRTKTACYMASLAESADILRWELPENVPPMLLYDYILKKQRLAEVDVRDPQVAVHVETFLNGISTARELIDRIEPELIVASHALGLYALLVWVGLQKGIRVVVPFGYAGTCRFWQVRDPGQIFDFMDHPTASDAQSLSEQKRQKLRDVGRVHLMRRVSGATDNLGATQAYNNRHEQIDRGAVCGQFAWDDSRPIVGVYAPNWFDYPHTFGMTRFRDFKDWLETTLAAACDHRQVSWLFKAHPCDEWYGGITLDDLVDASRLPPHVRLAVKSWNGRSLLNVIDAAVTCHGTIGIEMAALGKAALTADRGIYHDWGFTRCPQSRDEYVSLLAKPWWTGMDAESNTSSAELFAGWWWGKPAWQGTLHLEDDSRQWEIYTSALPMLEQNVDVIRREVQTVREWLQTDKPYYHVYKMMQADEYLA